MAPLSSCKRDPERGAGRFAGRLPGFARLIASITATIAARARIWARARFDPDPPWNHRGQTRTGDRPVSNRTVLVALCVFSALINLLFLTGSLYMLQVYDRVLTSKSIPTLLALSMLAAMLYIAHAILDFFRHRMLIRVARCVDESISARVVTIIARQRLTDGPGGEPGRPLRDLDCVRSYLAGGGPLAFFDLPWVPFYLGICFLFHPLIGIAAALGALVLVGLALCTEFLAREPIKWAAKHGAARNDVAEAIRRNADTLTAMGMQGAVGACWTAINQKHIDAHERASDVVIGLGNVSKVARMVLQSAVLGIGAYLVIQGEASAGIIIAGAILSARALAPIEQTIVHWRGFLAARQSWTQLRKLFARFPEPAPRLPLRKPATMLSVESVAVVPPGASSVAVHNVSFSLRTGSALGIIGPSGSGKSSLARVLVGAWRPARGVVRLDGAALDQWSPDTLGGHVGYLPQDNELLDGTIGENIARFNAENAEAILKAATQAGVHDMIVRLPEGYGTRVGEGGVTLSGGQRQRIALARALYNEPFLVVLDEPNSNLDADGEQALLRAIADVKLRGGVVILIAHRMNLLAVVDDVLLLGGGQVKAFGPRDEVFRSAVRQISPAVVTPMARASV